MLVLGDIRIKNPSQERKIFYKRLNVVVAFIAILFFSVFARVYYLQSWLHDDFINQSGAYHIRLRSVIPERGLILDYKGRVLAGNILSYNLAIQPSEVEDIHILLERLSQLIELKKDEVSDFFRRFNISSQTNDLILLKETLTEKEISRVLVNKYHLPGIEIEPRYQRYYPEGEAVSHALGYTGKLSEEEYEFLDQKEYENDDRVGKTGLERFYEKELRGQSGVERIGLDVHGNVVSVYHRQPPQRGQDIRLWLDLEAQKFITDLMVDHIGTVLVADTDTGGLISVVSAPTYDNNKFVLGLTPVEFLTLLNQEGGPLVNRAAAGRYPPGSTIKPFYGVTALKNGIVTPEFSIYDKGYFKLPNSNQIFRTWKKGGHGKVALRRAIRVSSDTYFYHLAVLRGYLKTIESLSSFGFGEKGALDVYSELALPLPTSERKLETENLPWFTGDTVNMGIGQGFLVSTPMQLLTASLILANRGQDMRPRMAYMVDGVPIYTEEGRQPIKRIEAADEHWDLVFKAMADVLHDQTEGTARYAGLGMSYQMAGKTGTAQVISLDTFEEREKQGLEIPKEWFDHALFLGFAPATSPKYAIVVILENGGSGSKAAKLARKVMDYIMENHYNKLSHGE